MEYLKKGRPQEEAVTQQIRDTVSEILSAVEKEGIAAVRRYSERLDGWNPESFVVSEEDIRRAEESVDDELKEHIRFAQEQVENFARLQKETLVDFEKETLPGVVLGQKQIPVNAVGSYTPSGMPSIVRVGFGGCRWAESEAGAGPARGGGRDLS